MTTPRSVQPGRARRVRFHVSVAGGLVKSIARADALGADALQIFPSNPRGWALPAPDAGEEQTLRAALDARGWPLFLHAPYLINLAAPDPAIHERSMANLEFALARGARLGAAGVVVHAGSAVGTDRRDGVQRAAGALVELVNAIGGIDVCVELTAGGNGRSIARTVPEVIELLDACGAHPRICVCIDTCHLWAAGIDWPSTKGLRELRAQVRHLGEERVRVVHINDSHDPLGSGRDHHAHLGDGTIGTEPFRAFLAAHEWKHAPLVLETPGDIECRRRDVLCVREFLVRRRKAASR